MAAKFEDIKIVSLDESRSKSTDPTSALMNIVLNLSASAPHEWASYFNDRWQSHIYMAKRRARILGAHLEICCVPDELQREHVPELKKIIDETNQAYRQFLAKEQQAEETYAAKAAAERAKLEDLKKTLKFD